MRRTSPLPAERVPLARYLAQAMLRQRPVTLVLLGTALVWTGLTLLMPSGWRTVLAVASAGLVLSSWLRIRRDERDARLFLEQHPASADPA